MKSKNLILLIYLFGLFLFLLPSIVEAACPLSCEDSGINCFWGPPYPWAPPNPNQRPGVERIGTIMDIGETDYLIGTSYCSRPNGKCKESGFPSGSNGQTCVARDECWNWGRCSDFLKSGVWDASESKCVTCDGKKENRILGYAQKGKCADGDSNYGICAHCGNKEGDAGNGQCESACGAHPDCDEVTPGTDGCDANCQPVKPDLIITDIWLDGNTIKYTIKNQGDGSAGESRSYLYIGGSTSYKSSDPVPSLSAGASSNESFSDFTYTCSGELDTIKVCADGTNVVSESNEDNNCREETWRPDLIISEDSYSPSSPVAGNSLSFSGTVKNIGICRAASSYTRLRIDENNDGSWNITPASKSTGILNPGESETETWSNVWKCPSGTHKYEICADFDARVLESNETNNCVTKTFTCASPPPPPPPPPPSCTGALTVSISGRVTCTVTASLTASNCDGKSWQVKDNGTTKCSGTVSGNSYSHTCSSWTVGVGTYTYYLYIGGEYKDYQTVTCQPNPTLYVNSSPITGITINSNTGHGGRTNYTRSVDVGTSVSLSAPTEYRSGDTTYYFYYWSGCDKTSGPLNKTCDLTMMDTDRTVTANYASYQVSVNSSPISGIQMTYWIWYSGEACKWGSPTTPFTLKNLSPNWLSVDILAPLTANGYNFSSWSGCDVVNNNFCKLDIDDNKTVTAHYSPTYTLSVNSSPFLGCPPGHTDNGDGTCTFTVYSSPTDGYIWKSDYGYWTGYNSVWNANSGQVFAGFDVFEIGQYYDSWEGSYSISRAFVFFDTSSIPANANITSATLSLYGKFDRSDTDFYITIQNGQPTYPHEPLEAGDYNKNHYSGNGGSFYTSGFSTTGYNNITLNETGRSWIQKGLGAKTKLVLRSSRDIAGNEPTRRERVYIWSAHPRVEQEKWPKLTVTYTHTPAVDITSDPPGYGGITPYQIQNIPAGTSIELTAPSIYDSYSFSGWSGDCSGTGTCNLTMNSNKNVTAAFLISNQPPTAAISCDPSECGTTDCYAYTRCPFHLTNDSTDQDGLSDVVKSEWDILNWGTDPDLSCTPPNALCNFTPQTAILTPGTYTVELYVEDSAGASDTATKDFYLLQEASAGFMCSLDNQNWTNCENLKPNRGELVYFKDDPFLDEHSTPSQGATITSRIWKINGSNFDSDNNSNPSTNLNQASNIIELEITDNKGRTASVSHTISTGLPLPEWREIPPF